MISSDVVIHLGPLSVGIAAIVTTGDFFYENAIMGMQLMELSGSHGTEKIVVIGKLAVSQFAHCHFVRTYYGMDIQTKQTHHMV